MWYYIKNKTTWIRNDSLLIYYMGCNALVNIDAKKSESANILTHGRWNSNQVLGFQLAIGEYPFPDMH